MDTHLTPALVSAPSLDGAGAPVIGKARASARSGRAEGAAIAPPFELARGEVMAVHGRAGQTLAVLAGRVWLTQTGGTGDHFVGAGERHTLRVAGRLVVEGDSATPAQWRWEG